MKALLLGTLSASTLTAALQIDIYNDGNCRNYVGTYSPGNCDELPTPDGGIGSWQIVCDNNHDNCASIEFFSSNNGGCADEYSVNRLQCPCNAEHSNNFECHSTYGLGARYWGERSV